MSAPKPGSWGGFAFPSDTRENIRRQIPFSPLRRVSDRCGLTGFWLEASEERVSRVARVTAEIATSSRERPASSEQGLLPFDHDTHISHSQHSAPPPPPLVCFLLSTFPSLSSVPVRTPAPQRENAGCANVTHTLARRPRETPPPSTSSYVGYVVDSIRPSSPPTSPTSLHSPLAILPTTPTSSHTTPLTPHTSVSSRLSPALARTTSLRPRACVVVLVVVARYSKELEKDYGRDL